MNIGAVCSNGLVSMRTRPSIGSVVPVWMWMSSSAGRDIGSVLLMHCDVLSGNGVGRMLSEERCERRYLVGGAFDADDRRTVGGHSPFQCGGQGVDVGDVDRGQPGEHDCQTRSKLAGAEAVVAVQVVVEQLLAGHT